MSDIQKIIDEYPKDYCQYLEAAYGSGMLSEGGQAAIENMFAQDSLKSKTMLDIGFGLGGAAFYLAKHHQADVTGIEINPWMVESTNKKIPETLKSQLRFQQYDPYQALSFTNASFDIVYSKGVLTHLDNKTTLFEEVFRCLKPGGVFIIDDWLSKKKGRWGKRLQEMCQKEELTLYAETEPTYHKLLAQAGFNSISMRDENSNYHRYNQAIVDNLKKHQLLSKQNKIFKKFSLDETIKSYQLIADSIKDEELLIRWFRATKS